MPRRGLARRSAVLGGAALMLAMDPAGAALSEAEFSSRVPVYLYRPSVLADQYVGIGIPSDPGPLSGALWYIRPAAVPRAAFGSEPLSRWVRARRIPGVDFSDDPYLTSGDLERFLRGVSLRLLNLRGTRVEDRAMPAVGRQYDLYVLEAGSRVSDAGAAWLKDLRQLRVLRLSGPGVTDKSAPVLAGLTRLTRLGLKGTSTSDTTLAALKGLPLRELTLSRHMTDAALAMVSGLPSLLQIDAGAAEVHAPGLTAIRGLPALHTLFLGGSVSDAEAALLPDFPALKRLDLTGAALSDRSAPVLGRLEGLEELALTRTPLSAAALGPLSRLPALRYLEISETGIAVENWRGQSGFEALQVLSLSASRRLGADDIRPLARLPKLHTIMINGVPLGRALVDHLRRSSVRAGFLGRLVPEAWAGGVTDADVEQALEMAAAPLVSRRRFGAVSGLARIHEAEASLEEVVPAVSKPSIDNFEATEQNFLGEFSVEAESSKKKRK